MRLLLTLLRPFSIPSLLLGLLFFAASLTPSLIPRGPLVQGVLGGLMMALGYFFGQMLALIWRTADMPVLTGKSARKAVGLSAGLVFILFAWTIRSSLTWQNDLRSKMGLEPADALHLVQILVVAVIIF